MWFDDIRLDKSISIVNFEIGWRICGMNIILLAPQPPKKFAPTVRARLLYRLTTLQVSLSQT